MLWLKKSYMKLINPFYLEFGRYLPHWEDAEDVLTESFVKILQSWTTTRETEVLKGG